MRMHWFALWLGGLRCPGVARGYAIVLMSSTKEVLPSLQPERESRGEGDRVGFFQEKRSRRTSISFRQPDTYRSAE